MLANRAYKGWRKGRRMLIIRAYESSLQEAVARLYQNYVVQLEIPGLSAALPDDLRAIPATYQRAGGFWLLIDDQQPIGMIGVRPLPGEPASAEIKRLFVLPDQQGYGYGAALLGRALRFAAQAGFRRAVLDTRRDRVAARRLYQRYGFVEIPRYHESTRADLYFAFDLAQQMVPPRQVIFPARIPPCPDFVVIATRYQEQWVYVRNHDRETFEMPGGHVEPDETPRAAALRELYEETGATHPHMSFVAGYRIARDEAVSGGHLYFAAIDRWEPLPAYEIAERRLFRALPARLTYPDVQPQLIDKVQTWLRTQPVARPQKE